MARNANEGTYNGEPTYCPVNCWGEQDCPYAKAGICHIDDPVNECDEFSYFFPSWEEWENS